jgi:AraC family transcriptional regulator, alkane utilization regulator
LPEPVLDSLTPPTDTDLLSDVLAALRVDSSALCLCELREPWGVQIDDLPMSISWTVLEGTVWMQRPDMKPIAFHRGDTLLLPRGIARRPCVLGSSTEVRPVLARDLWRQAELQGFELGGSRRHPQYLRWGGAGRLTRVVSTAFTFHDRQLSPLITALPEMMAVRASETEGGGEFIDALMRFALGSENAELPGYSALNVQTAQLLLALVVRAYALSNRNDSLGWLAGLGDPQTARVIASIYREPGRGWTVAALARIAGLSRSVFAERFLARVGQTPMQYLRAWRMHLACEALAGGNATVTMLAHDLGYRSEAAFRLAFRRVTGQPPREFRRHAGTKIMKKAAKDLMQARQGTGLHGVS